MATVRIDQRGTWVKFTNEGHFLTPAEQDVLAQAARENRGPLYDYWVELGKPAEGITVRGSFYSAAYLQALPTHVPLTENQRVQIVKRIKEARKADKMVAELDVQVPVVVAPKARFI
jgi:hypothetical protein